jgi:hypothetical protein
LTQFSKSAPCFKLFISPGHRWVHFGPQCEQSVLIWREKKSWFVMYPWDILTNAYFCHTVRSHNIQVSFCQVAAVPPCNLSHFSQKSPVQFLWRQETWNLKLRLLLLQCIHNSTSENTKQNLEFNFKFNINFQVEKFSRNNQCDSHMHMPPCPSQWLAWSWGWPGGWPWVADLGCVLRRGPYWSNLNFRRRGWGGGPIFPYCCPSAGWQPSQAALGSNSVQSQLGNLMMSCSGSPKKMQDDYLLNLHICVTLTLMLARLTATVQLFLPRSGWPLHSVTRTVVSHSKTADSNPCESDLACDFLELVKPCPGQCCTVQWCHC